jgi:membrane protease YdiL (CAAX protease family)
MEHMKKLFFLLVLFVINLEGIFAFHTTNRIACAAFLLFVVFTRTWELVHCALLLLLMSLSGMILPLVKSNYFAVQFLGFAPFLISTAIIVPFQLTRTALSWVKIGKFDRIATMLLGLTGVLSGAALLVWAHWTDYLGFGVQLVQGVSHYPKWFMVLIGIPFFAVVNAFAEEVVYRGVLQEALMHVFRSVYVILALQASAFAAAHFAMGFPNGSVGYGMVVVYGLMLGYLRVRTAGMFAPYLAHVIADLTIGYYLCAQVLS